MRLRYRVEAAADLEAIHSYIESENQAAAADVVMRIRPAVNRLSLFPKSGRNGLVPGTRELVVPNLPYIVVYRIVDDFVDVIAVAHAARDRT